MKLQKLAIFAFLGGVVTVTSCSGDGYWEEYTPKADTYSFVQKSLNLSEAEDFSVVVTRSVAGKEESVALTYSGDTDAFSYPNEVTFESGKSSANIQITCDKTKVTPGTDVALTVSLPTDNVESYNIKSLEINVSLPITWTSLGTGVWSSTMFEGDWEVEVFKAEEVARMYSIYDPLDEGVDSRMIFNVNEGYTEATYNPFFPQVELSGYYLYLYQSSEFPVNTIEGDKINFGITWGACEEEDDTDTFAGTFGKSVETVTMPEGWKE